jgi:peptidoglycan/LPS O-acetylase OafA/YrhL/lysophospholipase L1-like esterase
VTVGVALDDPSPGASPAADVAAGAGPRLPHVGAFDGLRGAAVAAVLLYHAGHLTGGWLGVDLFFVLSGYLITALLLTGWQREDRVGLRTFWSRRARRLAPALVITLIGVGIYAAVIATPQEQWYIRRDGFATMFEVANWRAIAVHNDYFAPGELQSPLFHTWSLSIEEQLYLFWPLVVAGVLWWRRSARAVFTVAAAGAVASAGLLVALHANGTPDAFLYYATHTRAAAVLLGAALAALRVVLGPKRWAATRQARHVLGVLGAIGLAVAWWRLDGASPVVFQGVLPLVSLAAVLVVASVADRRHPGPVGQAMNLTPLKALGVISYGAYLYHWPLYLVLDEDRTGRSGWPLTFVRIAVTIGLAALSYRFVEQPIRRGQALQGRQARAALPAAAALVAIALFAGTIDAQPAAMPVDTIDRASTPGAPLVMLAGDSVPLVMGWQISKDRDQLGISVANRGQPGCHLLAALGPIRGVEGNVRTDVSDCSKDHYYRDQIRTVHPDVATVLFGEFPNEAVRVDGRWLKPCMPEYLRLLRTQLDQLIDDLRTDRTPVVLLTAPGTQLSWVVDRVEDGGGAAGEQQRVACTNQVLQDIATARPGVSLVDFGSYVCPPGQPCLQKVDDVDLRTDGLHFAHAGATYVAKWIIPRVLAAAQGN